MAINSKYLVNIDKADADKSRISTPTIISTKQNINSKYLVDPKDSTSRITLGSPKDNTTNDSNFTNSMEGIDTPEVDNAFSYAFTMGLKDTYRGVKQMAGVDTEGMKARQKKLNELMQGENGGWVMAAYFGGALLDPAGWLIPFGKAKNLYSMAKMGMVSGAIAGATGYVDEDSLIDSRGKQLLLGAVGGSVVASGMGGLKNLGVKVTGKGKMIPLRNTITKQEMIDRGATTVQIQGSSVSGRGAQTQGDVQTSGARTLTVTPQEELVREDKSIFDAIKEIFISPKEKLPFPNTKTFYDIPKKFSKAPKWSLGRFLDSYQKSYEKNIGSKILKSAKTGEGGTAFGGAAAGFIGGPSYNDEATPALSTRFANAFMGGMMGYGGVKLLKKKNAAGEYMLSKKTVIGKGDEAVTFVESYPELFSRWFIDRAGLPESYRQIEIDAKGLETSIASAMLRVSKKARKLTKDDNVLLYNILSGDTSVETAPLAIRQIAKEAREEITKISQQFIDLGLITKETIKKHENTYLMRIYNKERMEFLREEEIIKGGSKKKKGPINFDFKKIGDQLKNRGWTEERTVKNYLEEARFEKNMIDEVVDKNHRGWDLPEDVIVKDNRLYKIEKDGTETLLKKSDTVSLRWEYSKPERVYMGEVEDAAITIEYTGLLNARTIGKFKFYSDVESKFAYKGPKKTAKEMAELDGGYIQMPKTKLDGQDHNKYGKLAGKYVPSDIYKDIIGMKKYQEESSIWDSYKKLQSLWKVSKTAWNPTVHVNNVVGNVVLSDIADVPILPYLYQGKLTGGIGEAFRALKANINGVGEKSDIVELAKLHGVLDSDMLQVEFNRFRLDEMPNVYQIKAGENEWNTSVGITKNIFNAVKKGLKNNKITGKLEEWYRLEDHVFRLNAFMHRIRLGDTYEQAGLFAKQKFIDYDIAAPAINKLRHTLTPFISFTYRMVPILAETAIMRPTKYAKYAALGYALTNMESYIGGEEAKVERALLPDYLAGNIMDLPFMPKKTIRIPVKDKNGRPKFVNISRLFPGGDILHFEGKNIAPFLPEPLQPSFGIVGDAVSSMLGYDIFRREPDIRRGDGGPIEETMEALDMFGRKLVPNFPFVPGSFSTKKLERALSEEKSPYRVPQTELEALMNSFGIKVDNKSIATLALSKRKEMEKKVRKKKYEVSGLKKKVIGGSLDKEDYIKKVGKIMEEIQKLQLTYFGRLQGQDPYGFRWFDGI